MPTNLSSQEGALMRKLIVSVHSTANNIVTGPPTGDETDFMQWAQPGIDDSQDRLLGSLDGVDTIVLGRGTYEDLVRKWPFVVTRTRESLEWGEYEPPTSIAGSDVVEQITELKQATGGAIMTFGSPILVQSLTNAGLVDEYQIIVHPVIVNEGRRLFENLDGRTDLQLVRVDTFNGGAMMITYAVGGS
jgi:dihydrofolate reductase